jgi:GR25 family glycosyltransferase involved in LPS biosynthesis
MLALYMAVQIWPPQASHIAVLIRAVVSQQKHCILEDLVVLIFNTEVFVRPSEVLLLEVLVPP